MRTCYSRFNDPEASTPPGLSTLVVVLPSDYSGGELLVRHKGQEARLDLRRDEPSEAAFAAFYADCRHEVLPIASGYRLALIYNLVRVDSGMLPVPPDYDAEQEMLSRISKRPPATQVSPSIVCINAPPWCCGLGRIGRRSWPRAVSASACRFCGNWWGNGMRARQEMTIRAVKRRGSWPRASATHGRNMTGSTSRPASPDTRAPCWTACPASVIWTAPRPFSLSKQRPAPMAPPLIYPLDSALLPAALSLEAAAEGAESGSFTSLRQAVLQRLERQIAKPLAPPANWCRGAEIACKCADCRELSGFLASPVQQIWRFKAGEARRRHVSSSVSSNRCDLGLETDTRGRPYTLVCTKNTASYERRVQQRELDLAHQKQLGGA